MSSDCAVLPASNETGFVNEPAISRPQGTQTIRERGFTEQTIEVQVDDRVYCMQDKYELPYTTVDQDGNTVVSVVDRIESHFPSENDWRATMRLKVFKNQTIKVTPEVTAAAQSRYPTSSTFLDATMTSLEYNRRDDRNLGEVYRAAMRWSRTSCTNSVTAINYTAYTDETDTTVTDYRTGGTAAYLYPYMRDRQTCTASNDTTYVRWYWNNRDTDYQHHVNYWQGVAQSNPVVEAAERLREILRSRMAPNIIVRSTALRPTHDIREIRARQTLRRLIGEEAYQKFAVRGFITFRGASQQTYQIFPGHQRVRVWKMGKQIEELCVVLSGDFPPTDSVIMRLLLIQESEERFRKIANIGAPTFAPGLGRQQVLNEINVKEELDGPIPLPQIFAKLKVEELNSMRRLVA